jgi:hypothetical protein
MLMRSRSAVAAWPTAYFRPLNSLTVCDSETGVIQGSAFRVLTPTTALPGSNSWPLVPTDTLQDLTAVVHAIGVVAVASTSLVLRPLFRLWWTLTRSSKTS